MRSTKGGIKAWLIFILVVLIVFGALFYLRNITKEEAPAPDVDVTEEVKKPSKPFAKPPELSEEEKKEADNQSMGSALLSGSLEDCDKITYDEELRQKCYDTINYALTLKSGDESQCEQIQDDELRQKCYDKVYFSAAMDAFDTSLCEKIKDEALKENCLNQIRVVMGRTAESASDCDSITDSVLKLQCLDNYYFSSSIEELDESGCDSIEDAQLKERCLNTIAQNVEVIETSKTYVAEQPKTAEEALATCDSMSGDEAQECKDEANYALAFEEKDLSYCSKIADSDTQQTCIKEQTENLDQYYFRQATAKRDESICNKIINSSLRSLCLDSI